MTLMIFQNKKNVSEKNRNMLKQEEEAKAACMTLDLRMHELMKRTKQKNIETK